MFVNEVLSAHLLACGYSIVSARRLGNPRLRHRGGIRSWPLVKREIVDHLREDPRCIASTMVDFYGLPQNGSAAWPGRSEATGASALVKAAHVETALQDAIATEMGPGFHLERFVLMHEFEGILFSDCRAFARAVGQPPIEIKLREIRNQFETPEDINDSPDTAPSKRITALIPGYEKPLFGNIAAMEVGLMQIRAECPHFNQWIQRLETAADVLGRVC